MVEAITVGRFGIRGCALLTGRLARNGAEVAAVSPAVVGLWLCCAGLDPHGVFLPRIRYVMVVIV